MFETEILIIGGGLAGLTAAIHLKKLGFNVTVVEKHQYPHHKVCGEYLSNEIIPYFQWLGLDLNALSPAIIRTLCFTATSEKSISTDLPLGGMGISRYRLDHFLYQMATDQGVLFLFDTVTEVNLQEQLITIKTSNGNSIQSALVIGAYGKRSALDLQLKRNFTKSKSPYLAVKAHYGGEFPDHVVSLHNFTGGYCGVSQIENQRINICYLAHYESFKKYKSIQLYEHQVLYRNPHLKAIFEKTEMLFDAPLTISQISFDQKEPVFNHMLMIGDTAGLIHPLCGNGMAMAIHGAKLLAETIYEHYQGKLKSRTALESEYARKWRNTFSRRLFMGRMLSTALNNQRIERIAMNTLTKMPVLLKNIIKNTHGKPIPVIHP